MFRAHTPLITLVGLLLALPCAAQDGPLDLRRDAGPRNLAATGASGSFTPTPEMWLYLQERGRYEDPKLAIRRRAELRATQRRERIASMEWFGLSNSRPSVSSSPMYGGYSPYWGSNSYDIFRWRAVPAPLMVQRPAGAMY
jgi:hypothetical protein